MLDNFYRIFEFELLDLIDEFIEIEDMGFSVRITPYIFFEDELKFQTVWNISQKKTDQRQQSQDEDF